MNSVSRNSKIRGNFLEKILISSTYFSPKIINCSIAFRKTGKILIKWSALDWSPPETDSVISVSYSFHCFFTMYNGLFTVSLPVPPHRVLQCVCIQNTDAWISNAVLINNTYSEWNNNNKQFNQHAPMFHDRSRQWIQRKWDRKVHFFSRSTCDVVTFLRMSCNDPHCIKRDVKHWLQQSIPFQRPMSDSFWFVWCRHNAQSHFFLWKMRRNTTVSNSFDWEEKSRCILNQVCDMRCRSNAVHGSISISLTLNERESFQCCWCCS